MRKFHPAAALFGAFLLPLGGVSASASPPVNAPQPPARTAAPDPISDTKKPHGMIFACGGKEYTSMAQLAQESTIVVRATPVGASSVEEIATIPFTVQGVRVSESFRGSRPGALLKIRQLGDDSVTVVDGAPLLKSGGEYVLFLAPSGLKGKADQYSLTSDAGEFRYHADGTADRLGARSRKLPATVTVESIRQVVKDHRRLVSWSHPRR